MSSVPSPGLAHLLSHAERRMGLRMALVLAEEDCSVEQWRVLSIIADGKGHPMTEIADQALMPAPSLTKLVDRMVADNLVHRRPDRADRRRVLLHLTARGRTRHQRAAHRLLTDQTRLLDAIDDHGDLVRLLARLTAALDQKPAEAPTEASPEKILPVS
ncbi:MarR family winged helix-turn-helix transcriptional regulator [Streptomyces hokutonensis]|uniref:MarR family winged helix-turn-helix transcriptional regulator n=1 Tax=Streptomyces hokutonensis TaxID=1306990 RepID=UPI0033C32BF0